MASQRRGGIIQVIVNGERQDCAGEFTYNLGNPKREGIVGSSGMQGFTETAQPAFIEGEITDRGTLNLDKLTKIDGATVVLQLAVGKTISLRNAYYAHEGTGNTGKGNIGVRFESSSPGKEHK